MMLKNSFFVLVAFLWATPVWALTAVVTPEQPLQGEAIRIHFSRPVMSASIDGVKAIVFLQGTTSDALYGFGLDVKVGAHTVSATDVLGKVSTSTVYVQARKRSTEHFTIPEKLGGTTVSSAKKVVSVLENENTKIMALTSIKQKLWKEWFVPPILNPVITDVYGYTRQTAGSDITHKGTDYRAPLGTPVIAMNRGIVRMVRNSPVYGKMIVIDHGQGLFTMYMHLSRILVAQGQFVAQGEVIGKSGATGYAISPHLHISVRLNGESIDPAEFLTLSK